VKPHRWIAAALLLAFAQALGGSLYRIGPIRPDLLCPLAVVTGLWGHPATAIPAVLALGAARDMASTDPFGTGLVAYGLAAVACFLGRRIVDTDLAAGRILLVVAAGVTASLALVLGPPLRTRAWIPHPAWIVAGSIAYTTLACVALLPLLESWKAWLGYGRRELTQWF
jgi:hypothetical protein